MKNPAVEVESDINFMSSKLDSSELKKRYKDALVLIKKLEAEKNAILELDKKIKPYIIRAKNKSSSEATALLVASDWHYEERVTKKSVNGLNVFNLNIADRRINNFFANGAELVNIFKRDIMIDNIILALLGDFISGNIHEELIATTQLLPIFAIMRVQERIVGGIEYLLKNTDCKIIIPCSAGNHSRITKKITSATELGNSLETYMYSMIAKHFKDEERVNVILQEATHTFVKVFKFKLRFHHGHRLSYRGGVGGIYIPVNKAIAQWNKSKNVDLDIFGHWHQHKDGGGFLCNGSLIGWNPFAINIKADFEQPKQTFALIDKKRGKTIVCPVFL